MCPFSRRHLSGRQRCVAPSFAKTGGGLAGFASGTVDAIVAYAAAAFPIAEPGLYDFCQDFNGSITGASSNWALIVTTRAVPIPTPGILILLLSGPVSSHRWPFRSADEVTLPGDGTFIASRDSAPPGRCQSLIARCVHRRCLRLREFGTCRLPGRRYRCRVLQQDYRLLR